MFGSATVKVKIDRSLYERSGEAAQRAGYSSTQEFVVHVLERAVADLEQVQDAEAAKQQLRGLGYIE